MTCASSAACILRPSTTSRPSPTCRPAIMFTGRPCLGAWASVWARFAQPELADICGTRGQADQSANSFRRSRPGCGPAGFLPGEHAGVAFRTSGDPILFINNPPGVTPEVRRKTLDGLKQLNEMNFEQRRRSGNAHPHPAIRDGLPHANERARTDRSRQGAGGHAQALRRRRQEAGHLCQHACCWPGGWSSAACGSCRSITTTGTTTATSPAGCRASARTSISRCWGLIQDLKQRGLFDDTLVIWGGEFGRTIYSPGRPDARRTMAGTITRAASRCGWPAAGQTGHRLWRDRRFLLQHRERPGPCSRLPCHGSAADGHQPREVYIQISRPGPEANRRRTLEGDYRSDRMTTKSQEIRI